MNNFGDFNLLIPISVVTVPSIILGFFIGAVVYENNCATIVKKQAIENNCAQYNPTNGTFEWVKK